MAFDRKEYMKNYMKEYMKNYIKKYKEKNPQKIKDWSKKYNLNNSEKRKEYYKKYWLENKEKIILQRKEKKEKLINKKMYLDLYDINIIDCFDRIYLTDGLYLCKDGTLINEK